MEKSIDQKRFIINAQYEIFLFALVILSIFNSIYIIFDSNPETSEVVWLIDIGISIFLMIDFIVSFIRAPSKHQYMTTFYGWMDFFGSLPFPGFRILRLLGLLLSFRKVRRSDLQAIGLVVVNRRAQTALFLALLLTVLVLEIGGVWVLKAEASSPSANIKTGSDALWWGYVTVATVGYGDRYPVTNEGRIVGIFVITVGVGLFSTLTSFIANWVRSDRGPRQETAQTDLQPSENQIISPSSQPLIVDQFTHLHELRKLIDAQETSHQQAMAEMKVRLEEIEKMIQNEQS